MKDRMSETNMRRTIQIVLAFDFFFFFNLQNFYYVCMGGFSLMGIFFENIHITSFSSLICAFLAPLPPFLSLSPCLRFSASPPCVSLPPLSIYPSLPVHFFFITKLLLSPLHQIHCTGELGGVGVPTTHLPVLGFWHEWAASSRLAFGQSTGNDVSGRYKHHYFPFFPFSPSQPFLIKGVIRSNNLFCEN